MDKELSVTRLKQVLRYDPATGVFERILGLGGKLPGSTVGSNNGRAGHIRIWIDGKRFLAHRLAWLWMTGEWPRGHIDHADRDGSNNRWSNLRLALPSENRVNAISRKQRVLPRGVYRNGKRYMAMVGGGLKGERRYLGTFDTVEEAEACYRNEAMARYGEFLPSA